MLGNCGREVTLNKPFVGFLVKPNKPMVALLRGLQCLDRRLFADRRPIAGSKPVVPIEGSEFNIAKLAGDHEGAMSTRCRH
jgi:hypothetical protein